MRGVAQGSILGLYYTSLIASVVTRRYAADIRLYYFLCPSQIKGLEILLNMVNVLM